MRTPSSAPVLPHAAGMSADLSWVIAAGVALLLLALCLFDARLLNDGDTYWHVAAGDWMLKHVQVPHIDTFSFSRSGARWEAHEWLAEVAMAAAFAFGSWNGVVMLYGAALAGTALILSAELRRFLAPASLAVALVLVFTCIMPSLLARPHILALPIATAWTVALLRARDENRAPSWWASGLMLVWANLHGSFVFGFVLLAFFAFEALWESSRDARWGTLRAWLLFSALSIAMAMATPEGPAGLLFPFQLMHMSSLAGIEEWRAMDFSGLNPFEIALAATLFICLTRGVTISALRALLLLLLLHMALQHSRHAVIAAPLAALILAEPIAKALRQTKPAAEGASASVWLVSGAIALAIVAVRMIEPVTRTDGPTTPSAALDHVPAALQTKAVLNQYDLGGYLIFRGVRPYIDGRTDLYGDAFMDHYFRITRPDRVALEQTLRDSHIAWTIFAPDAPAVAVMDSEAGWRRLYSDRFAVVHVRTASAF